MLISLKGATSYLINEVTAGWLWRRRGGGKIWLVAWRQNKKTRWDHNLDCLLYLKSEPFLFIHWKRHILSHRSWRQHTCSTHVNPVILWALSWLYDKSKPNVGGSPLMASARWLAQVWLCLRLLHICSYASWDVLTVHWCDSSNLVGKWLCLFAFARVFVQLTLNIQMTFWPCM